MYIYNKVVSTRLRFSQEWFQVDVDLFLPSVIKEPSILNCELNYCMNLALSTQNL
jgi:hypothetical protein